MAGRSKKITLLIFLFSLFIFLSVYIGVNLYSIYTSRISSSETVTKSVLECTFSFSASNMAYQDGVLSFNLKTSDEDAFSRLVINSSAEQEERTIELGDFMVYTQKVSIEDINLSETFFIYPEGCQEHNKKVCELSTLRCENIK